MPLDVPADLHGIDLFLHLHGLMAELFVRKNTDYAGKEHRQIDPWANFRHAEKLGVPAYLGAWVRKVDKETRAKNVHAHGNAVKDETFIDTLFDDAVYALIVLSAYIEFSRHGGSVGDLTLAYTRHSEIVQRATGEIMDDLGRRIVHGRGLTVDPTALEQLWREIIARAILAPPSHTFVP